ncbi:MAG: epoxyqueuosine reductase QueH [bacterium]
MKLLLHACCGPCFLGVWRELSSHKDIDTSLIYYNPNIFPDSEYDKRYHNLIKASIGKVNNLIKPDYQSQLYGIAINKNNSAYPGRCLYCYRLRLEKVAQYAVKNAYDAFSTTLLVSPYQQHDILKKIAEEVAAKHNIKFYYYDWRPYFRESQNDARQTGLYLQKYCGCEYSLKEASKTNK